MGTSIQTDQFIDPLGRTKEVLCLKWKAYAQNRRKLYSWFSIIEVHTNSGAYLHCFSGHSLAHKPYAMPIPMSMLCKSFRTNQTVYVLCKDHNLLQHHSEEAECVKIQRTCNESALKRPRLESFHCENHSTGTVGRQIPDSTVTPLCGARMYENTKEVQRECVEKTEVGEFSL